MDWFPAIFATIATIGFAFDRLLLRRLKIDLYERLQNIFIWLDDISISQYPSFLAKTVLRSKNKIFGQQIISTRSLILTFVISWLLVTIAALIFAYRNPYPGLESRQEILTLAFLPSYPIYVINFITDFMSLVVTTLAIKAVLDFNWKGSILILLVDAVIALALMIITFTTIHWILDNPETVPLYDTFYKSEINFDNYPLGKYFEENRISSGIEHKVFTSIEEAPEELKPAFQRISDGIVSNEGADASKIESFQIHIGRCHNYKSCIIYSTSDFLGSFISGYEILVGINRFENKGSRVGYISLVPEDLAEHHSNYVGIQWRGSDDIVYTKKVIYGSFMDLFGVLSTTTLLPSFLIIFALLGLLVLQLVNTGIVGLGKYFTEKTTEHDPRKNEKLFLPGTIIGISAGLMTEIVIKIF